MSETTYNFKIEDKIKTQLEIIKRMDSYISATNAKCAIAMSYCAAVLGWLAVNSTKMMNDLTDNSVHLVAGIFLACGVIFTLASLALSLKITFPVTFSSKDVHRGKSMIFFGDIASSKKEDYVSRFQSLSSEEIMADLSSQIHTLSGIAESKFEDLKTLTAFLCFGSVIPIGIFILLLIFDNF